LHSSYSVVWHLHFRLILSTALGTAVTLALLAVPWRTPTRVLLGWDAGVGLYLALTYGVMANASIAKIRQRAAIVDEGALAVLVLTTAAALASLVAVLAELGHVPNLSQIALGIFALHYAHEFYGEGSDHRTGGLVFLGDQDPDYWDFVYYSLVVAMTAQVSDVQITSKTIRRLTALHGVVSFFFNVTVLALTVNIISSLMSPNH
jgi:uncharacterized membrane protein